MSKRCKNWRANKKQREWDRGIDLLTSGKYAVALDIHDVNHTYYDDVNGDKSFAPLFKLYKSLPAIAYDIKVQLNIELLPVAPYSGRTISHLVLDVDSVFYTPWSYVHGQILQIVSNRDDRFVPLFEHFLILFEV